MKNSRLNILFGAALVVAIAGVLFDSIGYTRKSFAEDSKKTLEIERYLNEPLELVELKIGEKSIKEGIKAKFRDNRSKWGLDTVEFNEKDG